MKLPKSVRIGGHEVIVILSDWDDGRMGASNIVDNKIHINRNCSCTQQESTLLHEILEYINSSCNLELRHEQICTLEVILYQTIKDNKLIFGSEGWIMNCFNCGYPMTEVWEEGQMPTYVCDKCGCETISNKANDEVGKVNASS